MVARHGLFAAVKMPVLINRKDVITLLGIVSVVCGAMFSEERVNNSVALLSRVLVFVLFMGRAVTHFCCNLLFRTLEYYRTCSHLGLAFFVFETN